MTAIPNRIQADGTKGCQVTVDGTCAKIGGGDGFIRHCLRNNATKPPSRNVIRIKSKIAAPGRDQKRDLPRTSRHDTFVKSMAG